MGPLWGKIPFHYGVGHSAAYRKLPFCNGAHYGVTVMGSEMPLGDVSFESSGMWLLGARRTYRGRCHITRLPCPLM